MANPSNAKGLAQITQFLGLAFAGADMVIECDRAGQIGMALGATTHMTGLDSNEIMKRRLTSVVTPADGGFVATLLNEVKVGERRGPFSVTLCGAGDTPQRPAALSVFRLPQTADRIYCAVSLSAQGDRFSRNRHGLMLKTDFEQSTAEALARAEASGVEARLEMVEVPGLTEAVETMSADLADKTMQALGAMLRAQSYTGDGGAEVGRDRFAVVTTSPISADQLTEKLSEASGQTLRAITAEAPVSTGAPADKLRTIRYVLDQFIANGATTDFNALTAKVAQETAKIRAAVAHGALRLSYQPIVTLDGQKLHHYEALARFDDERSPAETIQLAEELGLIVDFDLAVIRLAVKTLAVQPPSVKIAANISGASLLAPGFVDALRKIVTAGQDCTSRLLLEITETAKIDKLGEAKAVIDGLRKAGHSVCLDDFGAGAASLEYVGKLDFDFIKIDGQYVKGMGGGGREAMLLKHMAALCNDLGVATIAEMIETIDMAEKLKTLGIEFGQGWAFGKAEPQPNWSPPKRSNEVQPAARRRGAVETWG